MSGTPLLCVLVGVQLVPGPAAGATFRVRLISDIPLAPGAGGLCISDSPGGLCTLRAAVQAANATPGEDVIELEPGEYSLTRTGLDDQALVGDLDVTETVTVKALDGHPVINAGKKARLFHVLGGHLNLQGVTLQNGDATAEVAEGTTDTCQHSGGAVCGTATLVDCVVEGSNAEFGGGLLGATALTNSKVQNNTATKGGGGLWSTNQMLEIISTTIAGNSTTGDGGGIGAVGGALTLMDSTIQNNRSNGDGGGVVAFDGVQATLTGSTIHGNQTTGAGGGIALSGCGAVSLRNSTLSGNTAAGNGGGLFVENRAGGTITLNNVTLASNTGTLSGGIVRQSGAPTVALGNTILAGNSPKDCAGTLQSLGYNLVQTRGDCSLGDDATIVGGDPLLGPLQNNHGPTPTHAPSADKDNRSPAIDAGNPAAPGTGAPACEATDQRGAARPQDGDKNAATPARCDIGAFEVQKDTDGDGVPDDGFPPHGDPDNCRDVVNQSQDDADGDLIGDACDACVEDWNSNSDGDCDCDGVKDRGDCCPKTGFAPAQTACVVDCPPKEEPTACVVNELGCTVEDLCPCDGHECISTALCNCPSDPEDQSKTARLRWRNHSHWRQCVKKKFLKTLHHRRRCRVNNPECGRRPRKRDRGNDSDADGWPDDNDICRNKFNPKQCDMDDDLRGDGCDTDRDGDGVKNEDDVCPWAKDPKQKDEDGDTVGDECDNCPSAGNRDQSDLDKDGLGDACDNCKRVPGDDAQADDDNDGIGTACDCCPATPAGARFVDCRGCAPGEAETVPHCNRGNCKDGEP